jgi:hypothetical protein
MKVSEQRSVSEAAPRERVPGLHLEETSLLAPKAVRMMWRRNKSLVLLGTNSRFSGLPSGSIVTSASHMQ